MGIREIGGMLIGDIEGGKIYVSKKGSKKIVFKRFSFGPDSFYPNDLNLIECLIDENNQLEKMVYHSNPKEDKKRIWSYQDSTVLYEKEHSPLVELIFQEIQKSLKRDKVVHLDPKPIKVKRPLYKNL